MLDELCKEGWCRGDECTMPFRSKYCTVDKRCSSVYDTRPKGPFVIEYSQQTTDSRSVCLSVCLSVRWQSHNTDGRSLPCGDACCDLLFAVA